MGSAAPAPALARGSEPLPKVLEVPGTGVAGTAVAQATEVPSDSAPPEPTHGDEVDRVRGAVLQALSDNAQNFLVSLLSGGEWSVTANELLIKIAESQTVLDMSLGNDAKRLAIGAASGALGRAVKLRVIAGAAVAPQAKRNGGVSPEAGGPGGRGRAEQDPIVRRMREKFGAEIRTVIDYRDKR